MHDDDAVSTILAAPPCPADEARAKAEAIRARNDLMMANLGLLYFHARRHSGRGVDRDDLVQVGSIALIKAAERYDPSRGAFGMFAGVCIGFAMSNATQRIRRARRATGVDADTDAAPDPVDERCIPPLVAMVGDEDRSRVRLAVARLSPGRRRLIELRFGMDGDGARKQREVARLVGTSRQAASQRERLALGELRAMMGELRGPGGAGACAPSRAVDENSLFLPY